MTVCVCVCWGACTGVCYCASREKCGCRVDCQTVIESVNGRWVWSDFRYILLALGHAEHCEVEPTTAHHTAPGWAPPTMDWLLTVSSPHLHQLKSLPHFLQLTVAASALKSPPVKSIHFSGRHSFMMNWKVNQTFMGLDSLFRGVHITEYIMNTSR